MADVRLNPLFAFQFPEKRPFFLDGIDAYLDRPGTFVHPLDCRPVYGVKVTGREGSFALGVVHALDRSPLASFHEHGTEGFDAEDIEGRQALTTVARGRIDAFGTGSISGWTLADKRIVAGSRSGSAGSHDSASVDLSVPLGGRWIAGGSTQHALTSDGEQTPAWGTASEVSIERTFGVGTGFLLASEVVTDDFRRETGFLTQSGLFRSFVALDHTFTSTGVIDTVTPFAEGEVVEEADGDFYRWTHGGVNVLVDGVHEGWVFGRIDDRQLEDTEIPGWGLTTGYAGQAGLVLEWSPEVELFRGMDFETRAPATTATGTLTASVRATVSTRLDLTGTATRHAPDDAPVEYATLLRARFNWQFTRPLGARIVVQHDRVDEGDSLDNALLVSGLVTWLDNMPGTAVHVGWTEIVIAQTRETSERIVFLKASVLLLFLEGVRRNAGRAGGGTDGVAAVAVVARHPPRAADGEQCLGREVAERDGQKHGQTAVGGMLARARTNGPFPFGGPATTRRWSPSRSIADTPRPASPSHRGPELSQPSPATYASGSAMGSSRARPA